jgi:hypothetical protein
MGTLGTGTSSDLSGLVGAPDVRGIETGTCPLSTPPTSKFLGGAMHMRLDIGTLVRSLDAYKQKHVPHTDRGAPDS